jgi:hypothetical protein
MFHVQSITTTGQYTSRGTSALHACDIQSRSQKSSVPPWHSFGLVLLVLLLVVPVLHAPLFEELYASNLMLLRRERNHRVAVVVHRLQVSAQLAEQLEHFDVALSDAVVRRAEAVARLAVLLLVDVPKVRRPHERLHNRGEGVLRSPDERMPPV